MSIDISKSDKSQVVFLLLQGAPKLPNEDFRLSVLHSYNILDTVGFTFQVSHFFCGVKTALYWQKPPIKAFVQTLVYPGMSIPQS